MNSQEARRILVLYRPGTDDKDDPEVAQALAVVPYDPELSLWFANHCAQCEAFRNKFRQIPVPQSHWVVKRHENLKTKRLAEGLNCVALRRL